MKVPRRTVHFVEHGDEIAIVSLVCEDLAQIDSVAEVIRSVGPTLVFAPLLDGLLALPAVTVHGPRELEDRTPTVCFSVAGHPTDEVATALAEARVAVWGGSYYAVEVMDALGLAEGGGAIRAGVSCYTTADDVDRLLAAVTRLT